MKLAKVWVPGKGFTTIAVDDNVTDDQLVQIVKAPPSEPEKTVPPPGRRKKSGK